MLLLSFNEKFEELIEELIEALIGVRRTENGEQRTENRKRRTGNGEQGTDNRASSFMFTGIAKLIADCIIFVLRLKFVQYIWKNNGLAKSVWRGVTAVDALDRRVTDKLAWCATGSSKLGFARPLMLALENIGLGSPWIYGLIGILLATRSRRIITGGFNTLIGMLVNFVVYSALKELFRRPRPMHNLPDMPMSYSADEFSFPSGHAAHATFLFYFMSAYVFKSPQSYRLLQVMCISITISRVLLGRHFVMDIVFGYLCGYFVFKYLLPKIWIASDNCLRMVRPIQITLMGEIDE